MEIQHSREQPDQNKRQIDIVITAETKQSVEFQVSFGERQVTLSGNLNYNILHLLASSSSESKIAEHILIESVWAEELPLSRNKYTTKTTSLRSGIKKLNKRFSEKNIPLSIVRESNNLRGHKYETKYFLENNQVEIPIFSADDHSRDERLTNAILGVFP